MDKLFLENARLHDFLTSLARFGELWAPTLTEAGVAAFSPLTDGSRLVLDYTRTQIPPKKLLFPFREEILRFEDGKYRMGDGSIPERVLFGVHRCDLEGLAYLDLVFLGDQPDPAYAQKREKLVLVGMSCTPDDYCFCPPPEKEPAADLFLSRAEGGYALSVLSAKGEAIVAGAKDVLVSRDVEVVTEPCTGKAVAPQDPELRFSGHPSWDRFATTCVSCGACSVCCPTCYCYDIREYPTLDGGGTRLREWDNCMFLSHGEISGGNFRPSRLDRLRYRFLHKYCGFTPLQGMTSCVGCGRCKAVCPVDIDLREIFEPQLSTRQEGA